MYSEKWRKTVINRNMSFVIGLAGKGTVDLVARVNRETKRGKIVRQTVPKLCVKPCVKPCNKPCDKQCDEPGENLRGATSPDLCARFSVWRSMRAPRAADQIGPTVSVRGFLSMPTAIHSM